MDGVALEPIVRRLTISSATRKARARVAPCLRLRSGYRLIHSRHSALTGLRKNSANRVILPQEEVAPALRGDDLAFPWGKPCRRTTIAGLRALLPRGLQQDAPRHLRPRLADGADRCVRERSAMLRWRPGRSPGHPAYCGSCSRSYSSTTASRTCSARHSIVCQSGATLRRWPWRSRCVTALSRQK